MSDYLHENAVKKMFDSKPPALNFSFAEVTVRVPIDENTKFPVKILTEEKAKEMVLKALEDVRAEIEADIEFNKDKKGLVNLLGQGKMMAVQIIDRKIAEVTKND